MAISTESPLCPVQVKFQVLAERGWGSEEKSLGAFCGCAAKPGFPLQSFLPPAAKKDFRFNPCRMGGQPAIAKNALPAPS
jgi:hypothetical protein